MCTLFTALLKEIALVFLFLHGEKFQTMWITHNYLERVRFHCCHNWFISIYYLVSDWDVCGFLVFFFLQLLLHNTKLWFIVTAHTEWEEITSGSTYAEFFVTMTFFPMLPFVALFQQTDVCADKTSYPAYMAWKTVACKYIKELNIFLSIL